MIAVNLTKEQWKVVRAALAVYKAQVFNPGEMGRWDAAEVIKDAVEGQLEAREKQSVCNPHIYERVGTFACCRLCGFVTILKKL